MLERNKVKSEQIKQISQAAMLHRTTHLAWRRNLSHTEQRRYPGEKMFQAGVQLRTSRFFATGQTGTERLNGNKGPPGPATTMCPSGNI